MFCTIYISCNIIFFCITIRCIKKKKFSTPDIIQARSKEVSSVSHVTYVDIITQVSVTQ